ncbi:polysaccharide biosynthesis protein [Schleiferiaceae bacterium]|nr:polysaccharide biosynthesis protein [Schleiferiaceae bacterium]
MIQEIITQYVSFDKDIYNYNDRLFSEISGHKILVVGGAGTIGSNYVKQILKYKPSKIVIVDLNENGLTELTRDLRSSDLLDYNPIYKTYPVSLLSNVFDKIFASDSWQVVANFSAHKHVRSEKDELSIEALIKNNVYGAIKLLNLCEDNRPKYFFSVSTDKAANPVNVMGASKSLMEKLILTKRRRFRVSTARFANVAFSNGSLLDGFVNRLSKNQALSCPEDIRRFFVTPKQSGQICLLATFLGDSGNIFFPKLDFNKHQIYFKDIALAFLKINGFEPEVISSEIDAKRFDFSKDSSKYPIYFFKTDTSGEKMYEEFYTENESYDLNKYDSLGFIESKDVDISFSEVIDEFEGVFKNANLNKHDVVNVLKKYVPDFNHMDTGKNLDEKM